MPGIDRAQSMETSGDCVLLASPVTNMIKPVLQKRGSDTVTKQAGFVSGKLLMHDTLLLGG